MHFFLIQNISKSKVRVWVFEIKDGDLPPQLPHGLPPTSLSLETEVEKLFLQDPSWLPIHDTDFAFQKFPKYIYFYLYFFFKHFQHQLSVINCC